MSQIGYYVRHQDWMLKLQPLPPDQLRDLYNDDASFEIMTITPGNFIILEHIKDFMCQKSLGNN